MMMRIAGKTKYMEMKFSGYVKEESIPDTTNALERARTFSLDPVRTWAMAYNMTSGECLEGVEES
jgi:hypothetical protein